MKNQRRVLWRAGMVCCVALLTSPAAHATTVRPHGSFWAAQDSERQSKQRVVRARDVRLDQVDEKIRKVLLANAAIADYLEKHDGVLFHVADAGATTGMKRVYIRLKTKDVGFVLLGPDGAVLAGKIGQVEFLRDQASGRVVFTPPVAAQPVTPDSVMRKPVPKDAPKIDKDSKPAEKGPTSLGAATTPAVSSAVAMKARAAADAKYNEAADPKQTESVKPKADPKTAQTEHAEPPVGKKLTAEPDPPAAEKMRPAPAESAASDQPHRTVPVAVTRSSPSSSAGEWLPITGGRGLMWISVVFVLALTLRTNQWLSFRNLDGVVLAGTCVLLAMRSIDGDVGHSTRWWSYLLLTIAALYWLTRGVLLTRARSTPFHGGNVAGGGMLVMLLFALSVAVTTVATAPVSPASRDAIIGGQYMATTGKLPAGRTVGADARSPLLYALHAAAIKITPPAVHTPDGTLSPDWDSRGAWMIGNWWESADLTAARLVNGLLLLATVIPLILIGRALHSTTTGLTMAAIFCIFPGTVECLARPDVMLATALISWAIAFATLERGAGFLSTVFVVLAGLAWPWAWLAVPVVAAYFLRQGWNGLGSVTGVIAGTAAIVLAMTWLAVPTVPRENGAVAEAGLLVKFQGSMTRDTLKIDRMVVEAVDEPDGFIARQKRKLWSFLINDGCTLDDGGLTKSHPSINALDIAYYQLASDPSVRRKIQADYEITAAKLPLAGRLMCSLRTVLEATWLPVHRSAPPIASAWDVWAAGAADAGASEEALAAVAADWVVYRRGAKIAVGLIAVIVSFMLLFGGGHRLHQLFGGLLAVIAGSVLVGVAGPVANLALIMPIVLSLLAVNHSEAPHVALPDQMPTPIRLGAEPRISVER